jgi:hypothetical protein
MENHTDGLEPEWLTSFSRGPKGWKSLMAVETKQRRKRSPAWIREQWHLRVQAQAESGLSAREYCHGYGPPTRTQFAAFSQPCSSSERSSGCRPSDKLPLRHSPKGNRVLARTFERSPMAPSAVDNNSAASSSHTTAKPHSVISRSPSQVTRPSVHKIDTPVLVRLTCQLKSDTEF